MNNEGTGGGGDAGAIYINGVADGTNANMEDDTGESTTNHVSIAPQSSGTADIQIHEMLFFNGTILNSTNAHEICCCGAATDALATKADRDAICGGAACTGL